MNSLWIVTNSEGADFACDLRAQAMEHCAIMAGDFSQFAPWNVTEYVPARDLAAAKALLRELQLRQWDVLDTSADGVYWRYRIDAAIAGSLPQKPAKDA